MSTVKLELTSQIGVSFIRACRYSGNVNNQLAALCAKERITVSELRAVHSDLQNATAAMQDVINQATKD